MGTYNLHEKKLSNFLSDTLSLFCRNILIFKEECCIQGKLALVIDKELSFNLNLDKTLNRSTVTKHASDEQCNGLLPANNPNSNAVLTEAEIRGVCLEKQCEQRRQKHLSDNDPASSIHNFFSETLSSFCRNMIEYKVNCKIAGKLCVTVDKENAMLVDIQENIEARNWHILTSVLSESSATKETDSCANARSPSTRPPIVIEPQTFESGNPNLSNENKNRLNISTYPSPPKRKRKQANPTSLSRLESSPKVVVIEPDACDRFISHKESQNQTFGALKVNQSSLKFNEKLPEDDHPIDLTNQLISVSHSDHLSCRLPLMVHLLKKQTLSVQINGATERQEESKSENVNIPPLIPNSESMGNLDALVERANKVNSEDLHISESHHGLCSSLPLPLIQYPGSTLRISEDEVTTKAASKASPKTRYVNSLLEVPDNEVQQMLCALMASGQTKDTCDQQQCSICCPTLAYIRFRDRNRKNKSRFCMEKIEQVVNVQMYGGGTKYRDVQRMFTTHLRKLRAKHICEKHCLCCEKLLLRESKKPNSNYLPHNVVPYRNPANMKDGVNELG